MESPVPSDPADRDDDTDVVIVGGGPAGLLLSHLLALADIDSIVLDVRGIEEILTTHRAGILEHDTVRLLDESGASRRVLAEGHEHEGIDLRFGGASHRVDFKALVGASVWLYPQTEVVADVHATRLEAGGDLRYGVAAPEIDPGGERPTVRYEDADGRTHELRCALVIGADGSRSSTRDLVPHERLFREYPFAWFGVMVEAPASAPELVYARGEAGFALISQRTDTVQRMYFQCEPDEDPDSWSDDRIWSELQSRVAGDDGFALQQGPVIERSVLPFRSFVQTPMADGRIALVGDAAHTVPPTGAKGLNLALADVRVLAEVVERALGPAGLDALADYTPRALARVWRAQHFSYWMTSLLHRAPDTSEFDQRRQLAELENLLGSEAGATLLAEGYTGWPA